MAYNFSTLKSQCGERFISLAASKKTGVCLVKEKGRLVLIDLELGTSNTTRYAKYEEKDGTLALFDAVVPSASGYVEDSLYDMVNHKMITTNCIRLNPTSGNHVIFFDCAMIRGAHENTGLRTHSRAVIENGIIRNYHPYGEIISFVETNSNTQYIYNPREDVLRELPAGWKLWDVLEFSHRRGYVEVSANADSLRIVMVGPNLKEISNAFIIPSSEIHAASLKVCGGDTLYFTADSLEPPKEKLAFIADVEKKVILQLDSEAHKLLRASFRNQEMGILRLNEKVTLGLWGFGTKSIEIDIRMSKASIGEGLWFKPIQPTWKADS